MALLTNCEVAHLFLKDRFISPDEVEKALKISYPPEILQKFEETLPSIEYLRDQYAGFILLPGTPKDASLADIPIASNFYKTVSARNKYQWAEEIVEPKWILFSLDHRRYAHKTWEMQKQMIGSTETYIPNIAELSWIFMLLRKTRRRELLPKHYSLYSSTLYQELDKDYPIAIKFDHEKGRFYIWAHTRYLDTNVCVGAAMAVRL
jgi:hypothetical protein